MPKFTERVQHAWNAFMSRDRLAHTYEPSSYYRPDRPRVNGGVDKSILTAIYNRIAMDASQAVFMHVRTDQNGRFKEVIKSHLNEALTVEANLDQTGRAFIQDAVMSLCGEGAIAIVPYETTENPLVSWSFDVVSMRVGKITQWRPNTVVVNIYNDKTGQKEDLTLPKHFVTIVENPLYAVMNEPNSTAQRLSRKLNLLDVVDEQISSGKLDMIIQLPYTVKSELRRQEAEKRMKDIEIQLTAGKYGIAYADSTEKITQLNRPIENKLMPQVEYLTNMLYGQLGITPEIMNGTASESAMVNYLNRTIEPILSAIADEMKRKFLTKTARSQGQSIMFFRDPFKLATFDNIANMADKLTRNEILSSNDFRAILGYKPDPNPRSDELSNKNMPQQPSLPASEQPIEEELSDEDYTNYAKEIVDVLGDIPASEMQNSE